MFQLYAQDFMAISSAEYAGINNFVKNSEREKYIEFSNKNYKGWVEESHMVAYGNLDLLDTDPAKYNDFISMKDESGTFVPDQDDREIYSVRTATSPPPKAYGPLVNMNIATIGANEILFESAKELGNELLASVARPFVALPEEEHAVFHSDHPAGADYPHSFFAYPVHKVAGDIHSEVVATITINHAWDVSMRKLLPESVTGIIAVVRNNCNQTFSFLIDGQEVLYLGDADYHDDKYNEFELSVDLSPHTNPNFTSTPGHCMYLMVRIFAVAQKRMHLTECGDNS